MQAKQLSALRLLCKAPQPPHAEPVSAGIPLAPGILHDPAQLAVVSADGRLLPSQAATLACWPDGSLRWALVDFLLLTGGQFEERVAICVRGEAERRAARISVSETDTAYVADTGIARIEVARDGLAPCTALRWTGPGSALNAHAEISAQDAAGRPLVAHLERLETEAAGPVRATFAGSGALRRSRGPALCRFAVRLSVFLDTALLRLDLTVHNPRRARHRGGLWDLGDPGSILLRSIAIGIRPTPPASAADLRWRMAPGHPEQRCRSGRLEIYQASSGGAQWASRVHRDRRGRVPLPFRGCRVRDGAQATVIDRASPALSWISSGVRLSVARPWFWQEFPSVLEGAADGLRVGLFPRQAGVPFELQGGSRRHSPCSSASRRRTRRISPGSTIGSSPRCRRTTSPRAPRSDTSSRRRQIPTPTTRAWWARRSTVRGRSLPSAKRSTSTGGATSAIPGRITRTPSSPARGR